MDGAVKNTWKPVVAGILNIVIGSVILIMLFLFGIAPMIVGPVGGGIVPFNLSAVYVLMPGVVIALLDITGGIVALRRRRWGWALTGSIAAAIGPTPLGIAAIVLIVISRDEFT